MANSGPFSLDGASLLVTGGTGSFGRAFVRHCLTKYKPKRLVVFSRDELKQHDMSHELDHHRAVRFFLGDVRDAERLNQAFRGVDYVVHAAALKQVPAAEYNPFEFVKTNILGAENIVNAAINAGVKKVVALSTDKAVNPINLYGTTKLASDKIFVAGNHMSGTKGTKFSIVRYGNVVGSRGSVVPAFKRAVAEGRKTLPITDSRMTRFWITLDQGVELVIRSFGRMQGGEIFVPKIPSMNIMDLAKALAPKIPTEIVGIRPGEKLHEVLVPKDEAHNTLEFSDHYLIRPSYQWWDAGNQNYFKEGKPVPEGFEYNSENNPHWLKTSDLLTMIENIK